MFIRSVLWRNLQTLQHLVSAISCNKCINSLISLECHLSLAALSRSFLLLHFNLYHSMANSADAILVTFFLFFPENSIWKQFAWNVNSCFLGKIRKIYQYGLLKILPRVLSMNWAGQSSLSKQCKPRSDATECSIWPEPTFYNPSNTFFKHINW